jgi:hypothetical protein
MITNSGFWIERNDLHIGLTNKKRETQSWVSLYQEIEPASKGYSIEIHLKDSDRLLFYVRDE